MKKTVYSLLTALTVTAAASGVVGFNAGQAADVVLPAMYAQGIVQSVDEAKGTVTIAGKTYGGLTAMDIYNLRHRVGTEVDVTYVTEMNGQFRVLATQDIDADKFRS